MLARDPLPPRSTRKPPSHTQAGTLGAASQQQQQQQHQHQHNSSLPHASTCAHLPPNSSVSFEWQNLSYCIPTSKGRKALLQGVWGSMQVRRAHEDQGGISFLERECTQCCMQ